MRAGSGLLPCLAVLTVAASANAATSDNVKLRFNAADRAAARVALPRLSDFGPGWTAGKITSDTSYGANDECGPQTTSSVLVETADASRDFEGPAGTLTAHVQLYETPRMVALDWQHQVLDNPDVASCVRRLVTKGLSRAEKLVSVTSLRLPGDLVDARAYRVVLDVKANGRTLRLALAYITGKRKRTEIDIGYLSPFSQRAAGLANAIFFFRSTVTRAV